MIALFNALKTLLLNIFADIIADKAIEKHHKWPTQPRKKIGP